MPDPKKCVPGECEDPTYPNPVKPKPMPANGGGGHLFVTSLPLPEEASVGAEYVLMDDLTDPSTYKGTYILNPDTNSFIASSSGGGSGGVVDTAMSDTSPNAVQNKVIKKYVDDTKSDIESLLEKKVFVAEYNVTTAAEIRAYLDSAEEPFAPILVKRGNDYYTGILATKSGSDAAIIRVIGSGSGEFFLFTYTVTNATWANSSYGLQKKLESGTNIKTINGESILGSGDLEVDGVPAGGTTGQALVKKTNADGDVEWADVEGNVKVTELTQAEYDALTPEQKMDGTIYFITDGEGGGSYVLPVASATKLGGIKIGNGLTIDENGVVSVNGGGGETPNLDAVLTKGNTTSKDINISGKIASEIASNRIHSQGYTVSKADDTATSGGGGSRTTSIGSGAMTLYGSYVKNGSIVDEKDFSFGYSVNRGEEKLTARVQMDDEMKQAWRDALNIADKNYTTTEKKVGTFLGKDLYEITLTGISINAAPDSGQVTWYNLTQNKGIQTSWDIVDYEVLSRIADNTSSATRSVLDGLLLRGGGNSNWTIGNKYQSAMHIRALTLRYVKEAI